MGTLDLTSFEHHNIVVASDGSLRTRKGFVRLGYGTGNGAVGAFTIQSASTTEPWHYIFLQNTATGRVTLHVTTEELVDIFTQDLGPMQANPVITYAVTNNQVMINSPTFSAPLYGLPGGGLIPALKTPSINPDTTAIDIPNGHVAAFGDRLAIAQGNVVFFNDPPLANSVDPRTFTGKLALGLTGSIFDIMQGGDGALYMFTSDGVFIMPNDALGQGQSIVGSISRIPSLQTSRSRNAVLTNGVIAVLQRDFAMLLPSMTKIPIGSRGIRRKTALALDIEDLRLVGELFPTSAGFIIGFRGKRAHYIEVDVSTLHVSMVSADTAMNVVGTLKTRDHLTILVTMSDVLMAHSRGLTEDLGTVRAVALGHIPVTPGTKPTVRRVTALAANVGMNIQAAVNGVQKTAGTPTRTGDVVVGTSVWGAATKFAGRMMRSIRTSFGKGWSDPELELVVLGADFQFSPSVDIEVEGQELSRREKN